MDKNDIFFTVYKTFFDRQCSSLSAHLHSSTRPVSRLAYKTWVHVQLRTPAVYKVSRAHGIQYHYWDGLSASVTLDSYGSVNIKSLLISIILFTYI